jgi:NADPH:quinone reductase-like Zn-dependent oxidoreductase
MKAIVNDTYGPIEVLQLAEIEKPEPGDDDVLIRVRAAGLEPGVWHLTTGRPYLVRLMGLGLRKPKARVRGWDVAGVVEAAGKNVTRFRPGDEVFGTARGSFAEYACARERRLAPKPANLTFEQAAVVPVSACTALQGLRDIGKVEPGQKVLVIGAGGGVGTFAVQLARVLGAEVTGVCSTSKVDLVRSLGADQVIDYTQENFADGRRRFDVILDLAGNRSLPRLRRALTPRGVLVMIGGEGGGRLLGGVSRSLQALALSPFVRHKFRSMLAAIRREDLEYLKELLEAGRIKPVVDRTYPLSEVRDAVRYLVDGRVRGKVAITI